MKISKVVPCSLMFYTILQILVQFEYNEFFAYNRTVGKSFVTKKVVAFFTNYPVHASMHVYVFQNGFHPMHI